MALAACTPGAEPQLPKPETPRGSATAPEAAPDPNAPTPYTAAQIREGCPLGRTIVFVIETPDRPPVKKRMVFVDVDDERATVRSEVLDEKDKVVGQPEMKISTWEELRKHALFPREVTTVSQAVAETPAGSFSCTRYTVIEKSAAGESKLTLCFAKELPGPPVEMTEEKDGKLVMSMTLLKNEAAK